MNIERIKELLARWAELEPAQMKVEPHRFVYPLPWTINSDLSRPIWRPL